jgi:hypothetical protein
MTAPSLLESTATAVAEPVAVQERRSAPITVWIGLASCTVALALFCRYFSFTRLEIFKMLLGSFFPVALMLARFWHKGAHERPFFLAKAVRLTFT